MSKLTEIAKTLGLDPEADEATILAAVTELKTPAVVETAAEKAERKAAKKARKLARQSDGQTLTLSAEQTAELISAANAGQAAAHQLAEQTFTHAWEKALSEGRAAPSQEDTMRALYRENSDLAIKTLDSFVQIVPVKPTGDGGGGGPAGPAPLGVDDDRFQLHRENPNVPEDELYALAANEIEDARNGSGGSDF